MVALGNRSGGLLSSWGAWLTRGGGSLVAEYGPYRAGSVAVVRRLSCPPAGGIFPGSGLEPVSLALTGRVLTTGTPEKSQIIFLKGRAQTC